MGFAQQLEFELKLDPRFRGLKLFIDEHPRTRQGIDPMASPTEDLRHKVERSALLTVLLSPQYLGSDWCRREREWWSAAQQSRCLAEQRHLALARIWPLANAKLPPPLGDTTGQTAIGFWFHDRTPDRETRPYAWTFPHDKTRGKFRRVLLDLTGQLRNRLIEFKERLAARERAEEEAARLRSSTRVIYLYARKSHARAWQAACDQLATQGFLVLPSEPDDVELDEQSLRVASRERVRALTECDALLLLASADTRTLATDMAVVARTERQEARARSNRLLPCAIVDPSSIIVPTPQQITITKVLQVEWLEARAGDWLTGLQEWLAAKANTLGERP